MADVVSLAVLRKVVEQAEILRLDATPVPIPGRRGYGRLRAVARRARPGRDDPLRARGPLPGAVPAAGLPAPKVNGVIEGMEVDFCWPEHRRRSRPTAGRPRHANRLRARSPPLRHAGAAWTVLRFTYEDVVRDPEYVGATRGVGRFVRHRPAIQGPAASLRGRAGDRRPPHGPGPGHCCWHVGDVLIDPGPEVSHGAVLKALDGEVPRAILLRTSISTTPGRRVAVRRWPDVPVYVHEKGAPHLIDPSRLEASAGAAVGRHGGALGPHRPRARGEPQPGRRGRHRARLPGRLHARARLASRLLLPRGQRLGVRGGRRRHPRGAGRPTR